jgi:GNAT superfamily N-acetyltransferase
MSRITIENIKPEYAKALEQLQRAAFPTLGATELMLEAHFLKHCELFPEGNFVALSEGKVVGLGSGFLCQFDFEHPNHSFMEFIAEGFYSHHDPNGDWYYGADISVHPDYRRRGIGAILYDVRKHCVKTLNRRGIVAGGLIPDYAQYKEQMTVGDYAQKVAAGELYDSTLSFQLKHGFELRGMLENYIEDEASNNWATLIVWENLDYSPEK